MRRLFFAKIIALSLFAPSKAYAVKTIMEGIAATNNSIWVDTTNARVGIGASTATYKLDVLGAARVSSGVFYGGLVPVEYFTSINSAISWIGSGNITLTVASSQTLTASLTVPSNVTLDFKAGGTILKASNYKLRINGPIVADRYQIFSGFTTEDISGLNYAYPEWWGSGTAAMPEAVDSSSITILGSSIYTSSTTLYLNNKSIVGNSINSELRFSAGITTGVVMNSGSAMSDLTINGNGTGGTTDSHGIVAGSTALENNMAVRNVFVENFATGIKLYNAVTVILDNITTKGNNLAMQVGGGANNLPTTVYVRDSQFNQSSSSGVYIVNANVISFDNCIFQNDSGPGLFVGPTTPQGVFNLKIKGGDIEGSAIGTGNFYFDINGLNGTVDNVTIEDVGFNGGSGFKNVRFQGVTSILVKHNRINDPGTAGTITIDSTSTGWLENDQYSGSATFSNASSNVVNMDSAAITSAANVFTNNQTLATTNSLFFGDSNTGINRDNNSTLVIGNGNVGVNLYQNGPTEISGSNNNLIVKTTETIKGNAFSVGGSTFIVTGGSVVVNGPFTVNVGTITGMGSVPSGAVMAFYLGSGVCPKGWQLCDGTTGTPDLRGIFIRGAGTSGSYSDANAAKYTATYGSEQDDQIQGHKHSISGGYQNTGAGAIASGVALGGDTPTVGTPTSDGTNGTPRTGVDTHPANYALTYCMKE